MSDYKAIVPRLNGPLVPILSAFDDQQRLDTESVAQWIESLIDRGIKHFWTTHGTTHFMCLADDEIVELTRCVASVTRGRSIFIASTAYHWPLDRTRAFIQQAAQWGVDAVKVQVDWRSWPPEESQLLDFYHAVAAQSPLPLLAYTFGAPGITPAGLSEIIRLPQFVGLKNDSGDFYEQTAYLKVVRDEGLPFSVMTGGTMESFLHASQFGASAFAVGTAIYAPNRAIQFYQHIEQGQLTAAAEIVRRFEQPVIGEFVRMGRLAPWACFHAALYLQRWFRSSRLRFPLRSLGPEEITRVEKLLRSHDMLGSA